jgi:murein DD-endopeptidase MepM/ murein hydrolase activator NlpD
MKKILLILLIVLPLYLAAGLYFLDKSYLLSPIEYKVKIVIRSDSMGDGVFASPRNGGRLHQGIDLLAPLGSPVFAARSGVVAAATSSKGMGNFVIIQHPGSIVTIYGHLQDIYAEKNALVRQGELIGSVGKTGNANYRNMQPHLHFELRKNGVPQDPLLYLQ